MNKNSSDEYCRNFVRQQNYPLYLLHFFIPRPSRADALALMALHCELKSIPEKVQDQTMQIIRLKWWYDSVMDIYKDSNSTVSPVLDSLNNAIKQHHIHQDRFEAYFSAFEKEINSKGNGAEDTLYGLLYHLINNSKAEKRFSRVLGYHKTCPPEVPFRALRMWINYR